MRAGPSLSHLRPASTAECFILDRPSEDADLQSPEELILYAGRILLAATGNLVQEASLASVWQGSSFRAAAVPALLDAISGPSLVGEQTLLLQSIA